MEVVMAGRTTGFRVAGMYIVAWALGAALVATPWLAIRYVPIDVSDWASIYIAGAVGGLALEMLLGRGRLELPSPASASAEEQEEDSRRPLGPMIDVGFLSRVSSAGIAAVALLLVYYALVGEAATPEQYNVLAADPATFGWAVFLGASSPAIWTAAQRMVDAKIAAAEAGNTAKLERLNAAIQTAAKDSLVEDMTAAKDALTGIGPGPGTPSAAPTSVLPAEVTGPLVDAGAVITDIEEVVGEAAAAQPGDVDVESLSLNLFERLPAAMAGLTGPPTTTPEATEPAPPPAPADTSATASVDRAVGILEAALNKA
jgi:hypothetical protein